ncbi:cell wall-binding repeat-containing protein [Clostridium sp. BJN0013]|uniref:cell wall-binding repeat-containing protein n=1 Tax=Clostridium sp. BJN0013 TaxID=3236840 RepID=UPI0034C64B1F
MLDNVVPFTSNQCLLTPDTSRICGVNSIDTSIKLAQLIFAHSNPGAVILLNKNEIFDAITASSLLHHPINAPILFTERFELNRKTLDEILRLKPKGYNEIDVILVGNLSRNIQRQLNYAGLNTYHIFGRNHYETACNIFDFKHDTKNILIVSGENYQEILPVAYFSAHHGDSILFVNNNKIPYCTLERIKKITGVNVYIIGSSKNISNLVEQTIGKLPNISSVQRIDGMDPYTLAVNFSKYIDSNNNFGWGRSYRDGHAFTFGTLNNAMEVAAGVVLAHMGKHTPLLLVNQNSVPEVVKQYIKSIKPLMPATPRPPFMHGFIIGCTSYITKNCQFELGSLLSIDSM